MKNCSCKAENGYIYSSHTSSWNENDQIGLFLCILFVLAFILLIMTVYYWIKTSKLSKKWLISTLSLWVIFIAIVMNRPIRALYMVSSLFSLSTHTPEFMDRTIMFPNHIKFEEKTSFLEIKSEVTRMLENTNQGQSLTLTKDTYGGENQYIGSDVKIVNGQTRGWRILNIKAGSTYSPHAHQFPELCKILRDTPEIISCVVSVLEPHVMIPLHVGYYKGIMRYMIPTHVPQDKENIFLCVNGIKYHWSEGVGVLWDDTYPHKVYNNTDEIRVVIYMDVLRPFSGFKQHINQFFLNLATNSSAVKDEIKRTEVQMKI